MVLRFVLSFFLLNISLFQVSNAQVSEDIETETPSNKPGGAYCNVFYVTSYNAEVIPFDDVCFVVDEYSMGNAQNFRCIGPIKGTIDLFRTYPWSIQFHMPFVSEGERLSVITPMLLDAKEQDMAPGKFFLTLSDNRDPDRARRAPNRIDFAATKGKASITEYHPMKGDMKFPEYTAQIDVWMDKVEYINGEATLAGSPTRVKMVLRVEALE